MTFRKVTIFFGKDFSYSLDMRDRDVPNFVQSVINGTPWMRVGEDTERPGWIVQLSIVKLITIGDPFEMTDEKKDPSQ